MIRFIKMHGLGNDYVYVDCFEQGLEGVELAELARRVSDRHRGVGSDGLILIARASKGAGADVRMEMYNADGSRGEMCGNGIRCVAKYAVEAGLVGERRPGSSSGSVPLRIETDRGVLDVAAMCRDGKVDRVRVEMGPPILEPARIPVGVEGDRCVGHRLEIDGGAHSITCVSMGNPHAVAFVESLDGVNLRQVGPLVERHRLFPNRVNFHIAEARSRREATMRTWERGSGVTMACGTGACAVVVAGVLEGRLDETVLVHLPGGDLSIQWDRRSGEGRVFMTGPAEEVFRGEWRVE